jgi:hypothetical protein
MYTISKETGYRGLKKGAPINFALTDRSNPSAEIPSSGFMNPLRIVMLPTHSESGIYRGNVVVSLV